jgi:hypothetical protein
VGDRHGSGVARFLRCSAGQDVGFLVSRRALVAFDPNKVNSLTSAAQVADHVLNAAGHALAWSCLSVASPRNRAGGVGVDRHVLLLGPLEPVDDLLHGRHFCVEGRLLVSNAAGTLPLNQPGIAGALYSTTARGAQNIRKCGISK